MDQVFQSGMDAKQLMGNAPPTAGFYLAEAIKDIDREFGEGYAKKNPALVAAYMNTCALDYGASCLTRAIDNLAEATE